MLGLVLAACSGGAVSPPTTQTGMRSSTTTSTSPRSTTTTLAPAEHNKLTRGFQALARRGLVSPAEAVYRFVAAGGTRLGHPETFQLWYEPGKGPGPLVRDEFAYRAIVGSSQFEFVSNSQGNFECESDPSTGWRCYGPMGARGILRNGTIIPAMGYELPIFDEAFLGEWRVQGSFTFFSRPVDGFRLSCMGVAGPATPSVYCLTRGGQLGYTSNTVATEGSPLEIVSYKSGDDYGVSHLPVPPVPWPKNDAQLLACPACQSPWQ